MQHVYESYFNRSKFKTNLSRKCVASESDVYADCSRSLYTRLNYSVFRIRLKVLNYWADLQHGVPD